MGKRDMFPAQNQRVLSLRLIIIMIHVCSRFHSAVLSGTSESQAKKQMVFLLNNTEATQFPTLIDEHNSKYNITFMMENLKSYFHF